MTGSEIRGKFLKYFEERGHAVIASSGLVPKEDPTLLFTNSGMVNSKTCSLEQRSEDTPGLLPHKNVFGRVESITTWKMWGLPHVIIPFLKCWAIFPSATISRMRP